MAANDESSESQQTEKTEEDEKLIRLALRNSPFFSCLDEEQVASFVAASICQRYEEHDVVISEGCVDQQNPDKKGDEMKLDIEEPIQDSLDSIPGDEGHHIGDPSAPTQGEEPLRVANSSDEVTNSRVETSKDVSQIDSTSEHGDASSSEVPNGSVARKSRSVYIVRSGKAGVWYQPDFNPATLGPGNMFGEGGFLFGRQHSASIVAKEPLECWVVDLVAFRTSVLPSKHLRSLFDKYSVGSDEKGAFLSPEGFMKAVADQLVEHQNNQIDSALFNLHLANTYSTFHKDSTDRIYFEDFCFLHLLVARPDSEVDIAFLSIDERRTGQLFLSDVAKFLQPVFPDVDYNEAFFDRYFGKDRKQTLRQMHFSQFLVDLQREIGKQAFLKAVDDHGINGYLEPAELVAILKSACGWRLPRGVVGRLEEIFRGEHAEQWQVSGPSAPRQGDTSGDQLFSYGDFLAFQEVLGNLPFICNLIDRVQEIKEGELVSREDFKVANQVLGLGDRFSRRQVEIVFRLFDLDQDGFVSHDNTIEVCGIDYAKRLVLQSSNKLSFTPVPRVLTTTEPESIEKEASVDTKGRPISDYVKGSLLDFVSSAVFGGIATVLLYPVDFVKTRMMNQRQTSTILYKNSLDCLQQAIRSEGITGVYRGITPQLLCVAPERAIKFQVHDLVRQTIRAFDNTSENEASSLWVDAFAGGCAGASQLLVTNPLEIGKIRLQMQGETYRVLKAKGLIPLSAPDFGGVVRSLGFPGVYKGAAACLMRDIPFSAIYFPSYVAIKNHFANDVDNELSYFSQAVLSGTLAAIPASILTTPADVVKTRLQSVARPGEVPYHGIRDCIQRIHREEGVNAFFRGTSARVLRICPQFGATMLVYEGVMQALGLANATARPPVNVPLK